MKGVRSLVFTVLSIILIITLSAITYVDNAIAQDPEQEHLVIATVDNEPISTNRLLFSALRDIGISSDFLALVTRESWIQANDGIIDGVTSGYPDLHLSQTNLIQVPYAFENSNVRVFARSGSNLQINSWDELSGLRVGILVNRTYILERLPDTVTITEKPTNRAVLDGLVSDEYDAVVLAERDHENIGERHNVIRVGQVDKLPIYLYLNKKHENLSPRIVQALEAKFADGSASQILNDLPMPDFENNQTILHILSTSIELNREDQFITDLRRSFEERVSIDWMTVNLDARRLSRGQISLPIIASLIRTDIVPKNVSAVIVSGDTALDFVKDYYYLYFRNTPVLFYGTSPESVELLQEYDYNYNFTGIVKNIEAELIIDNALTLFPETTNLFVFNDYTAEGMQYRNAIEQSLEPFRDRLNIEYNANLSAAALLDYISTLPDGTIMLVGSYFVDANYQYYTLSESKRLLERYCNVPIFSFYSTEVDFNAVGGKCLDYHRYAEVTASMLEDILDGKNAEDIPTIYDSTGFNRWVFDNVQLSKFDVNTDRLPDGAEIINKPPTIWESNPQFFIAMIIIIIVGLLLIIGAIIFFTVNLRHNAQKSKLQKELATEKSVLEGIFNSAPEIMFAKDLEHRFIRVNKSFQEHFGCDESAIIGTQGYENELLGSIVDDYLETEKAIIKEKRLILVEKRIKGIHGISPVFEIISTPLVRDGEIIGIVGAAYDISHRIKAEEATLSASRAKSNFLANMSHEMRTPLTAVIGLTELILETVQLDDETYSNLIKVYRSGETILNLVNDILDISKIEADKLALNPHRFDLPSLLNDTITQSALYIEEKPIKLVLDINNDLPNYLFGDELRLKQILNNLLSNAFKFTTEGTVTLGVRCDRDGEIIKFTAYVRDTGIGIRPADIDKLFTLYGKMEEESVKGRGDRRIEGTGLGLSISKKVADMMDGSITVESEYGRGSVFTVKLKLGYISDDTIGQDVVESLKSFDYSIKGFEHAKMTRMNLSYARVLIVDDNPTNLDVAKGLMGLYGMTIDCLTGGQQAVDAIRGKHIEYDAIFMDHMMPGIDGVEATRIIREEIDTEYAANIPIIALTANAVVGNEEMFLSKGFQAFIAKPIDIARLDLVLRQWVRDKDAEALLPVKVINVEARRGMERKLLPEEIPGLDIEKGIAHFGFSEVTYFKVLESYVHNTRPLLGIISGVNQGNMITYGVTIHGIKGSSHGIFAQGIADSAQALERAANAGNYDFINANNRKFLDDITSLLNDIEETIAKNKTEIKMTKERLEKEQMSRLLSAVISFDIDEIDDVMASIEAYEYTADDGLVVWLRESVNQGKYKSVKEKLTALLNNEEA